MFKADIHVKTHDMDEGLGIGCSVHVEHADLHDKMILLHTFARALEMRPADIALYALAEKGGLFCQSNIVEVHIPKPIKEDRI